MQLKKLFAALAVSGGLVFTLAGCGDRLRLKKRPLRLRPPPSN